jgi:hypothetical protein
MVRDYSLCSRLLVLGAMMKMRSGTIYQPVMHKNLTLRLHLIHIMAVVIALAVHYH